MKLTQRIKCGLQKRLISILDLDRLMDMGFGFGQPTHAGANVNEQTAMKYVTVFACVKMISETVSSLPLITYQRLEPRGKRRAKEHRLYELLHDQPNLEMSSLNYRECKQAHLLLWGNAYSEIETDANGSMVALWPLPPWMVKPWRGKQGNIWYQIPLTDGTYKNLPAYKVLHIAGLGFNGLIGLSPIAYARESLGLGMAAEEFGARFFGQGTHIGGVIEHPDQLGEKSEKNLRKSIDEWHTGLSRGHRFLLLEEGMKYQRAGIPPEDAQFIQTRIHQDREIAKLFNVPLHKLADMQAGASFASIEQKAIDYVVDTIRPWLVRWEQTIRLKLFTAEERQTYFAEFLVDGLMRGDAQARANYYRTIWNIGALSINDIRDLENMNPIGPEGDKHYVPLNVMPVGELPEQKEKDGEKAAIRVQHEMRSVRARQRLASQWKSVWQDAAQRVVNREVKDIRQAAEAQLGRRDAVSFTLWLEDFYRQAPDWIKRTLAPVVESYAEAINAEAAEEINVEPGMTPELQNFSRDYLGTLALRHTISSQRQLNAILRDSLAEGLDPLEEVNERLDEWQERRAGKIAMEETVKINGAIAIATFAAAGVVYKRWVAAGSKSCPFCQSLDGRIVGIDGAFAREDEALEVGGERLTFSSNIGNPPAHKGCICSVEAERGSRSKPNEVELRTVLQSIMRHLKHEVPQAKIECGCGRH